MDKYVDSKVWLNVPGGVEGWDVEELNSYIDIWNSSAMCGIRSLGSFFGWLSYEIGRPVTGFSVLWRSKLDSQIHFIKED